MHGYRNIVGVGEGGGGGRGARATPLSNVRGEAQFGLCPPPQFWAEQIF